MTDMVIQLIMAAVGSVAFAVLFHMRWKRLPFAALGGLLAWLIFLLTESLGDGVFVPTLIASLVVAAYAEILARVCKGPSTPFFAIAVIPLIPGRALYYGMFYLVEQDMKQAGAYGSAALKYAVGIAAGMGIVWAVCDLSRKIRARIERLRKAD